MKRVFAGIVVLLLLLSLMGCAKTPEDETAASGELVEDTNVENDVQDMPQPQEPDKETEKKPDEPQKQPTEEKPSAPEQETPSEQPEEKPSDSKDEQPDEQPADTEEPEESDDTSFSMDKAVKVATFNIKCAMYGKTMDQVAQLLKDVDADLVGLQEVDCNTSRSGGVHQVQLLAEKAGYPYYCYTPVVELGKNSAVDDVSMDATQNVCGQAILSKHPIGDVKRIWPTNQRGGIRCFTRHEITIGDKTVAFYNGHLDFDSGRFQYRELQDKYMVKDKYAICVGDFNETMDEMYSCFDPEKFYCFAFGEDMTDPYLNSKRKQVIDHIVVSKDSISWYDGEVQNGYYVVPHNGASDHNLVYGYINLLDE